MIVISIWGSLLLCGAPLLVSRDRPRLTFTYSQLPNSITSAFKKCLQHLSPTPACTCCRLPWSPTRPPDPAPRASTAIGAPSRLCQVSRPARTALGAPCHLLWASPHLSPLSAPASVHAFLLQAQRSQAHPFCKRVTPSCMCAMHGTEAQPRPSPHALGVCHPGILLKFWFFLPRVSLPSTPLSVLHGQVPKPPALALSCPFSGFFGPCLQLL